jgi:predicted amidohydrolase YtcJ
MPKYVVERTVAVMPSQDELDALARREIKKAAELGVTWVRSYISTGEGKIYCEYEAPDADALRRLSAALDMPCDRVSLVSQEINPSMFE